MKINENWWKLMKINENYLFFIIFISFLIVFNRFKRKLVRIRPWTWFFEPASSKIKPAIPWGALGSPRDHREPGGGGPREIQGSMALPPRGKAWEFLFFIFIIWIYRISIYHVDMSNINISYGYIEYGYIEYQYVGYRCNSMRIDENWWKLMKINEHW